MNVIGNLLNMDVSFISYRIARVAQNRQKSQHCKTLVRILHIQGENILLLPFYTTVYKVLHNAL